MLRLVVPDASFRRSYVAAMEEFRAEGRGEQDDITNIGNDLREYGATWHTAAGFNVYLAWLRFQTWDISQKGDAVPSTTLWWVAGGEFLGRIAIRHRLTPWLREVAGHIGYDVRPSARGQGHASAMLCAALPVACDLGVDPALLTCAVGNAASRRVIEANGGVLEDERDGRLRFWVPTSREPARRGLYPPVNRRFPSRTLVPALDVCAACGGCVCNSPYITDDARIDAACVRTPERIQAASSAFPYFCHASTGTDLG